MHGEAAAGHVDLGVFRAFQLHKSIGLTVLALSAVRLGWRLANRAPTLPAHMPGWERFAAQATHWAFYVLMIALPLTGWLYVSAGWSFETNRPLVVETHYFGLFKVPFLLGLTQANAAVRSSAAHTSLITHWALGWATLALSALHIAAALKHQFIDRDGVLAHMVPGAQLQNAASPPPNAARSAVLGGGLAIVALALIGASYALFTTPDAPPVSAPVAAPAPSSLSTITVATDTTPPLAADASAAASLGGHASATPTSPIAHALAWRVDAAASRVGFTITYGGQAYEGAFDRWRADIRFDAGDLAHSFANVTMETASAHTSDQMQTSQIGSTPWLDTANFPTAAFTTTAIRHLSGESYEARGVLTIKGHSETVTLPFALIITGNHAVMTGQLRLDRQAFGVGAGDASIGDQVAVQVRVVATRTS
jgi:cytochrome b561